ncbi:MAG: lipopolysaccharide biosynthesis protein [Chthoniobacteraceae bacterium]
METTLQAPAEKKSVLFDNSAILRDLKKRTIGGASITFISQAVKFTVRTGTTAVMARILVPADFGLIGMVTVVTGIADLFKDGGLSLATVQRKDIEHEQISNLFWINISISAVLMLILLVVAPGVSWFYREPRLTWIVVAFAFNMFLSGFGAQHQALLRRNMKFGRLAFIDISSLLCGSATGLWMARHGYHYWALVGMIIVTSFVVIVSSYTVSGWMPGLPSRRSSVRSMVNYGAFVTGSAFVSHFSRNGDNMLIGWRWGSAALGQYSRAYALLLQPWQQILSPMASIIEPGLCRLSDQPERFRRYYQRSLQAAGLVSFPLTVIAFLNAKLLVGLLLGSQWGEAVNIFQCLAPAALIGGVRTANGWLLFPSGRANLMLKWTYFTTAVAVGGFVIGLPFGALGVATSLSITDTLMFVIGIYYATHKFYISAADVFKAIMTPIFGTLAGLLAAGVAGAYPLWVQTVSFVIVYAVTSGILSRVNRL